MNGIDYEYFCKSFANFSNFIIRVYEKERLIHSHNFYNVPTDPILPYAKKILLQKDKVGVFVTPLFQLYGYFTTKENYKVVIGPSKLKFGEQSEIEEYFLQLGIPLSNQEEYLSVLNNMPNFSYEKITWLLYMLNLLINNESESDKSFVSKSKDVLSIIEKENNSKSIEAGLDNGDINVFEKTYAKEKVLLSYIREGNSEKIKEIFSTELKMKAGTMAKDTLRQVKNMFICGITIASRAAIDGGLDTRTAFQMSDIYIQKVELLDNYFVILPLIGEMMVDYAERVKKARHGNQATSMVIKKCARYVSTNITKPIKISQMAKALKFSPSYLCAMFKDQMGIPLSQYIMESKIEEAKRLLKFSESSILDIANHLSFCSQSHFQNSFKKVTGMTPLKYKNQEIS